MRPGAEASAGASVAWRASLSGGACSCPTTHARSRSLRAWRRSASARVCTSARPASAACTTWSRRSWTTPWTRRWPGYCDRIEVTLLADGGVRVIDNGRGIPVDEHPVEKRPAVEVVLTTLHAGGKFDGKSYAVSGGLHGVGVSVVNALSTRLEVEIRRDGYVWRQAYELRRARQRRWPGAMRPTRPAPRSRSGPTTAIFETTDWSFETLSRRLQEMAFLNKGLTISLTDERPGHVNGEPRVVTYRYAGRHRRLRALPQRDQGAGARLGHRVRRGGRPASRSRSRCSGTRPTPSRCTPSPTRSTRPRAAPTRRASGRR